MNKLAVAICLLIAGVFSSGQAFGKTVFQSGPNADQKVNGTVTDKGDGATLPGVNIMVKGTTIGTSTDPEGNYELKVPSLNDTLVVSFVGYETQEIPINGRTTINIQMESKALVGDEVVVTGYQIQKKVDLTGAVSVVSDDDIADASAGNPVKSLQGKVPGLFIQTNGAPDAGATVRIRGVSTLGNNDPLYVIDGVPTKSNMAQNLDPNEIKSIQVLKDASAASIYGARASNGVIIITTKQGKKGDIQVNFNTSVTSEDYVTKLDVLNTRQRGQALWQAAINDGTDPASLPIYDYQWHRDNNNNAVLDKVIIPEWVDKDAGIKSADTDWFDEISRPGLISSNNLTVSTGSDRGSALVSLSYYNNKGIVKQSDFNRYSVRVNSNYKFFDDRLNIGENLQVSKGRGTPLPSGLGGTPLWLGLISQPILPVHTVDGGWAGPIGAGFSDRDNPVRLIWDNRWDKNNTGKVFGNVFAEFEVIKNLKFKSSLGIDYTDFYSRNIQQTYHSGFLGRDINSLNVVQNHELNYTWDNTLNYNLDLQKHSFDFLLGMEAIDQTVNNFSAYREQFAIQTKDYFTLDAGTGIKNNTGYSTGYRLLSYFGKVNYSFAERYLASATLRYDGSSRFGSAHRFGLFPAFSLGWRISNEKFMKNRFDFLSDLKLRFGWGQTGNQEIENNASYALYRPNYGDDNTWGPSNGTAYDLSGSDSGTLPSGFLATQTGNPNLKWEATTESNVGLDIGFLDQKITGSFDYFKRNTNDILIQPAFIAVVGDGGSQWLNGASVETNGFEVQVKYRDNAGDFNYNISANVGSYHDKITDLPESVVDSYPGNSEKNILGHSMNSIFGYVADGLFQNEQEVQDHADQPGADVGRIRYQDLNGDGVINTLDQKYIGVQSPDYEYGINASVSWKQFNLSLFLQGVQGIDVYNEMKFRTDFVGQWTGANFGARTLDAWSPDNTDSRIPALSLSDKNNESRSSTYYVENGSYLKMRNAELGYNLPSKMLDQFHLDKLRIYVRGENLFTIKDTHGADQFTAPDPENPGMAYPRPRKFTLGLNVSF